MDPELEAALNEMGQAYEAKFAELETKFDEKLATERERADRIEVALKRAPRGEAQDKGPSPEQKAFSAFVRRGVEGVPEAERKALSVSSDPEGGYLVAPEFSTELIRNLVEFSPVRQAARVGQMRSAEIRLPKRTAGPTAAWVAEQATRSGTQPAYGQISLVANEAAAYVDVSMQLLEDAAFNVEAELARDFAEEFGRLEGVAFLNGDGVGKPSGIMADGDITSVNSGAATTVTADGLIDVFYALPAFYRNRSTWMLNSTTLGSVRKLKDGNGDYLLRRGLAEEGAEFLLGRPVVEAVDMPDEGAGAFPVLLGDFEMGYRVMDRTGMTILRDPYSLATSGQVRFHVRRRVGGIVTKAEAFRKVKCST